MLYKHFVGQYSANAGKTPWISHYSDKVQPQDSAIATTTQKLLKPKQKYLKR